MRAKRNSSGGFVIRHVLGGLAALRSAPSANKKLGRHIRNGSVGPGPRETVLRSADSCCRHAALVFCNTVVGRAPPGTSHSAAAQVPLPMHGCVGWPCRKFEAAIQKSDLDSLFYVIGFDVPALRYTQGSTGQGCWHAQWPVAGSAQVNACWIRIHMYMCGRGLSTRGQQNLTVAHSRTSRFMQ